MRGGRDRTTATAAVVAVTDPTEPGERAFLAVYDGERPEARTQVVPLPDGAVVTVGRLETSTIRVDHETVSRQHARITRRGAGVVVEDLGSRNGTRLNGVLVKGVVRVSPGDEIAVGPIAAVLGVTRSLRRRRVVGSTSDLEEHLAAEVDRAHRYHRPLGLVMLRLEGAPDAAAAALERVASGLRRMDYLADYGPDEFAILLPEADRAATDAAARRLAALARAGASGHGGVTTHVGLAVFPEDGAVADELLARARAALRTARTGGGRDGVAAPPAEALPGRGDVVVVDPVMQRLYALAKKVAGSTITVLVIGETGAGKELVAEAIHRESGRAGGPFVKLNCASLPETLLESELFGHERGAFTGADRQKVGYFEAARGGTILLDEIGEMPAGAQAKLLRVLERRTITRLGGTAEVPVDVRVVCATNRNLDVEVQRGRFREDLYFRVSAFMLMVPPLRDRRGEIEPLALHFAQKFARELGQKPPAFAPRAMSLLARYDWPGNVRELRNAIERAVVLQPGGVIDVDDLPERIRDAVGWSRVEQTAPPGSAAPAAAETTDVRRRVAEVERQAVAAALEACGGNQTRAARRLGISRFALIRLMEKYGLKRK